MAHGLASDKRSKERFPKLAATLNAANVVTFIDTQSGLLTAQNLETQIANDREPPLYSWAM